MITASTVERDVVQGALQDPQHINVTNYGIADCPELPGVSEVYTRGLSSSCADASCNASIMRFHTHIPMSNLVKISQNAKESSSTCVPT